jgi:hypothetical protein
MATPDSAAAPCHWRALTPIELKSIELTSIERTAEAIEALTARAERLAEQVVALDAELAQGGTFLPHIFLVESEYQREVLASELAYVRRLTDDLHADRITWPEYGSDGP